MRNKLILTLQYIIYALCELYICNAKIPNELLSMNNYTLIQRNADFMRAVRQQWKKSSEAGRPVDINSILGEVLSGHAPEFYVSYDTAYKNVSLARRGALPMSLDRLRRKMWIDLAKRVDDIMADNKQWSYGRALVEAIDRGDAPSWYLNPMYARSLYYTLLREGTVNKCTLLRDRDMR